MISRRPLIAPISAGYLLLLACTDRPVSTGTDQDGGTGSTGDGGTTGVVGVSSSSGSPDQPVCLFTHLGNSVSSAHGCGRAQDGRLWCWGSNASGQLGVGHTDDEPTSQMQPRLVETESEWLAVSTGGNHTCGIQVDGTLWCWGSNGLGQLGIGEPTDVPKVSPTRVGTATDWVRVATGHAFTCGMRADGTLWCWGGNEFGQLGIGAPAEELQPIPVQVDDSTWVDVTVAEGHACGIRAAGTLWCWGDNSLRQLGLGNDVAPLIVPTAVGSDSDWTHVRTGDYHTCGLKTDGTLWCWGHNEHGALGQGDDALQDPRNFVPRQVGTANDWKSVSLGDGRTCGLREDGVAWCWGQNSEGELGLGGAGDVWTPTAMAGHAWTDVSVGGSFSCGISSEEELWCWGWLDTGGLGPPMSDPVLMECETP